MSIPTKTLVTEVNASIAAASEPLEILQLLSVSRDFDQGFVYSVANTAALPDAVENKGRLVFVEETSSYRWSDGVEWSNDFTSTQVYENRAWSWGTNTFFGILGDGTSLCRSSPVSVIGDITDWSQLSAHAQAAVVGLRENGTAWGWGSGTGDGTSLTRSSPVEVTGGFTDWCQVSAGNQKLGVRTNGTLWMWGGSGGDDTTIGRSSPVLIAGGFTDWCQADVGVSHSLGVRINGTAWAWGNGQFGSLGNDSATNASSPVSVLGGFTDWCQVSAGELQSIGLRTNGTAWGWGYRGAGKIGDGTNTTRSSPVSVVGGFTDWCQVSAGGQHSLAIRTNGTAWAWGNGFRGQLGAGNFEDRSSPVSILGGFTDWCQVSGGGQEFSLGLRTNGTAWGWGRNYYGQIGVNPSFSRQCSPNLVTGGFTDWSWISAGGGFSVAIRSSLVKGF